MVFETPSTFSMKKCYFSTSEKPSDCLHQTFENALICLNMLQSNAMTIQKSVQQFAHNEFNPNIKNTEQFMEKCGMTLDDLNKLKIIHVSGSKGKGTTCAFTESILRSFGLKTGFFSSPHLICVTERIRIDGKPISKIKFNDYFWNVYTSMQRRSKTLEDMPSYFKFLTILSFHIFLMENVDVAIVEVGIGGEYDCTNVMRNTKTVGISSIGLEHTNILGTTLREIAWQKGGIIKNGTHVFTVDQQANECVEVLQSRAQEKKATIYVAPDFYQYKWPKTLKSSVLNSNQVQRLNASLAIQLCYDFLKQNSLNIQNQTFIDILKKTQGMCLDVPSEVVNGLEQCVWNGRFQIIQLKNLRIFIDGAHTMESLSVCIDWFKDNASDRKSSTNLLLFNATGDRDVKKMLELINSKFPFDMALFSTNICTKAVNLADSNFFAKSENKCYLNAEHWNKLQLNNRISQEHCIAERHKHSTTTTTTEIELKNFKFSKVFSCTTDALDYVLENYSNADLLVTGSLHLVGAMLRALEKHKEA